MRFAQAFNQLVYTLFYPGVLGSMIFNLADPLRDISIVWFCTLLVGACFIVDYLYLTLHLLPNGRASTIWQPVGDLLIAISFCFSYFLIARADVLDFGAPEQDRAILLALVFLFLSQALILIYDVALKKFKTMLDIVQATGPAIGIAALILVPDMVAPFHIYLWSAIWVLIVYTYRLIRIGLAEYREAQVNA